MGGDSEDAARDREGGRKESIDVRATAATGTIAHAVLPCVQRGMCASVRCACACMTELLGAVWWRTGLVKMKISSLLWARLVVALQVSLTCRCRGKVLDVVKLDGVERLK